MERVRSSLKNFWVASPLYPIDITMPPAWTEPARLSEAKRPRVSDVPVPSRQCRRSTQSAGGLTWFSTDIALAAQLLQTPNARFPTILFSNTEEKRRVFTLVYDVLRYKSVLSQALKDVYFFTRHPHLKEHCHFVWLLFFDLYKRDFTLRDPLEPEVEAVFASLGLHLIDEVLWQWRVKLAATVSRLRIKSGAHSLSSLLPMHLQRNKPALEENVVTGWVNIFLTSMNDVCASLEEMGLASLRRDRNHLEPLTFKTDHLLPRFLHMLPSMRETLVHSRLVGDRHIIMQERTFCIGAVVMAQLLKDYALSGRVAQTHFSSPSNTAYLANLLINNDKIEALLVFGAGYRKADCEQYLKELGVENTQVFAESFAGISPDSRVLDNVIAVLATPPNTNSSVLDPVDLAVARGGDLQILQELTSDDFATAPRDGSVDNLLVEQRDTLRRAMSKPQIQFTVYETHSRFTCENEDMAATVTNELNNYAAEVHLEEVRRAAGETQDTSRNAAEQPGAESGADVLVTSEEELSLPISPVQTVVVPPSDLFELADLPDLCPNFENCLDLSSEGTYVAVIKRKEITRLDPKYMIQMAEARGLFGRPDGTPKVKSSGQTARAKAALAALQARADAMSDKGKTRVKVEMDRIAAPTRASLLRDVRPPLTRECPRFTHHLAHDGTPSYLQCSKERRTFLSAHEEEELIQRLYTCPKVNLYPPRLYEDLPPLKFWNSPASTIENYLRRKVFHKRLQLAYEFNQTKEPGLCIAEVEGAHEIGPSELLTNAMKQLAEDREYFEHFDKSTTVKSEHSLSTLTKTHGENKDMWDRIKPPSKAVSVIDNIVPEMEDKFEDKFNVDIRKHFIDYKDVYQLQNLRNDTRPPLAETIGLPVAGTQSNADVDFVKKQSVSFCEFGTDDASDVLDEDKLPVKTVSERSLAKLPKVEKSSLTTLIHGDPHWRHHLTQTMKEIADISGCGEDDLPKLYIYEGPERNLIRRGTLQNVRDSVEVAHKNLSRVSKSLVHNTHKSQVSYVSLASHKDSLTVLMNQMLEKNSRRISQAHQKATRQSLSSTSSSEDTMFSHEDSILLAVDRLHGSKDKVDSSLTCVCHDNQDRKSIQFMCQHHANMNDSKLIAAPSVIRNRYLSILSKSTFVSAKDSLVVAHKTMTINEKRRGSIGCQVEEEGISDETYHTKDVPKIRTGIKGSKKQKVEQPKENADVKLTPSKLRNYLMESIRINQVVPEHEGKHTL